MNREIKFRGKRKDNGKWIFGGYMKNKNGTYISDTENYHLNASYKHYLVVPETVGQYTGLKDKNGKEIYEGDIVDIHQTVNGYNQFVIEYSDYKFSSRYYNQNKKEIRSFYNYDLDEFFEINELEKELEVIGNIYETGKEKNNV